LDTPVLIDPNATGRQKKAGVQTGLVMMPGERYEIIVDFADPVWLNAITAAYTAMGMAVPNPVSLILRNTAPTVNGNPKASTEGRIMQFRVSANAPLDSSYNPASGIALRPPMVRLPGKPGGPAIVTTPGPAQNVQVIRELTLNEVMGAGGPLEVLVNNSKWMGVRSNGTPIEGSTLVNGNWLTELPNEGDTEIWEIVNTTVDNHPIHLHGVQFQILNRQAFDTKAFATAYAAAFTNTAGIIDPMTGLPYPNGVFIPGYGPPLNYFTGNPRAFGGNPDPVLLGVATPPFAYEAGWKDTVIAPPGQVTRIVVRIAPQDVPVGTVGSFTFNPSAPLSNGEPGVYVWHCHITDHEDNEMMRPDMFMPNPAAVRTYIQGVDY
jgi:FtsP/CotA-like multicopper oxidase with cupredoxin domain